MDEHMDSPLSHYWIASSHNTYVFTGYLRKLKQVQFETVNLSTSNLCPLCEVRLSNAALSRHITHNYKDYTYYHGYGV